MRKSGKKLLDLLKTIKNDDWLKIKLDEHLQRTTDEIVKSNEFHPSGSSAQARVLLLGRIGIVPEPISAQLQRIFDNGNDVHDRYCNYFKRMGILYDKEVSCNWFDPMIRGRFDVRIVGPDSNLYLIEMKSMNSGLFSLLRGPRSDHLIQWQLYSLMSQTDDGIILYENKDNQQIKTFTVHKDDSLIGKILEKFRYVNHCDRNNLLADPCILCNKEKCRLKEVCNAIEEERQSFSLEQFRNTIASKTISS